MDIFYLQLWRNLDISCVRVIVLWEERYGIWTTCFYCSWMRWKLWCQYFIGEITAWTRVKRTVKHSTTMEQQKYFITKIILDHAVVDIGEDEIFSRFEYLGHLNSVERILTLSGFQSFLHNLRCFKLVQ